MNQLIRSNHKREAFASLIIGIICLIAGSMESWGFWFLPRWLYLLLLGKYEKAKIYFVTFILLSLAGIILGIIGLKSSKKIFAVSGIILSVLSLILLLFFLFLEWTGFPSG